MPHEVTATDKIPFLPISFFKTHKVATTDFKPEIIFESSGTTGSNTSNHLVKDMSLYRQSFIKGFELFYGNPSKWCILGLLPGYLERKNSSLIAMVEDLIKKSGNRNSGFYLHDHEKLYQTLAHNEIIGQPTLLIGVTYALLDFAENHPMKLQNTIVMETGGMKGKREEITREEVHAFLKNKLGLKTIHSEYGMTELLSQAYGIDGKLHCPSWMKVLLRDETDPFSILESPHSATGVINIMDLANLYSCSFIATQDVGKANADGSFEVLGRMDNSDIRGCSLMVTSP